MSPARTSSNFVARGSLLASWPLLLCVSIPLMLGIGVMFSPLALVERVKFFAAVSIFPMYFTVWIKCHYVAVRDGEIVYRALFHNPAPLRLGPSCVVRIGLRKLIKNLAKTPYPKTFLTISDALGNTLEINLKPFKRGDIARLTKLIQSEVNPHQPSSLH